MSASNNQQNLPEQISALLDRPAAEFSYLAQLPPDMAHTLPALVEKAIEERRHVILQALDDAGRHLPGPLRRKLSQRVHGD